MASKEESINLLAHREVLRSFFLSLRLKPVLSEISAMPTHIMIVKGTNGAQKDALEMAHILDAERESVKQII